MMILRNNTLITGYRVIKYYLFNYLRILNLVENTLIMQLK